MPGRFTRLRRPLLRLLLLAGNVAVALWLISDVYHAGVLHKRWSVTVPYGTSVPTISPDGRYAAIDHFGDRVVDVWDTTTGRIVAGFAIDGYSHRSFFTSDSSRFVASTEKRTYVVSLDGGRPAVVLPFSGFASGLSPDGKYLLGRPVREAAEPALLDLTSGATIPLERQGESGPPGLESALPRFTPDGRYLYALDPASGAPLLWDPGSGKRAPLPFEPFRAAAAVTFGKTSDTVAYVSLPGAPEPQGIVASVQSKRFGSPLHSAQSLPANVLRVTELRLSEREDRLTAYGLVRMEEGFVRHGLLAAWTVDANAGLQPLPIDKIAPRQLAADYPRPRIQVVVTPTAPTGLWGAMNRLWPRYRLQTSNSRDEWSIPRTAKLQAGFPRGEAVANGALILETEQPPFKPALGESGLFAHRTTITVYDLPAR